MYVSVCLCVCSCMKLQRYTHSYVISVCKHWYSVPVLLNQARAGHRPARAWFLEIVFVKTSVCVCVCLCVCVCVSAPQAIKNYSREMNPE